MTLYRANLFLALATLVAGCTGPTPTFESRREMFLHNAKVQPNVVFLADNQRTLATAEPIFEQSRFVRSVSKTAHRRPAMENFSLDVVRHIIDRKGADAEFVIHVGDMLNNSCRSEFGEVMAALQANNGRPAYVAPGNHEGFYLGITAPIKVEASGASEGVLNELGGWAQICTPAYDKRTNPKYDQDCLDKKKKCDENVDYHEYLRFETDRYLTGYNIEEWDGYARNIIDKYSYTLSYLKKLDLDKYCNPTIAEDGAGSSANRCPARSAGRSLVVRCAAPKLASNIQKLSHMQEICWTELNDGKGPKHDLYNWTNKNKPHEILERNEYRCKEEGERRGEDCRYREKEPWRHFVVQHVIGSADATGQPVHFLLLDTASYEPGTVFNSDGALKALKGFGAADNAQIRPIQREIITRWVKEIREKPKRSQIVLVGHHPIKDLNHPSKRFLATLAEYPNVTHYISGDNHDGYDVRHADLDNLREVNLGATIDKPIEYALGGPSTDRPGVFDLARYFMTPGKDTKDGHYKFNRNYAESDGTFETCIDKGYAFEGTAPAFAPSASKGTTSTFGERLVTPAAYAGLPNIGAWLPFGATPRNVRNSSLFAYKSNRLIDAIEVYGRVYDDVELSWPEKLENISRDIEDIVKNDDEKEATGEHDVPRLVKAINEGVSEIGAQSLQQFRAFYDPAKFISLHKNLARALDAFEDGMVPHLDRDDVHWARLCRALVEAHRDESLF